MVKCSHGGSWPGSHPALRSQPEARIERGFRVARWAQAFFNATALLALFEA